MSPAPTDALAQKTPAELRYFVENPSFYEPALVAQARQELRRRGLAPDAPETGTPAQTAAYAAPAYPSAFAPAPASRRSLWLGLLLAAVLLGGGWLWQRQAAAEAARAAAVAAEAAARARKGPPKLETVATTALPDFAARASAAVEAQLARVPAAERAALATQPLRQYRELSRRFWTAETMSEHLTEQARAGQPNPLLTEQALLAREAWSRWNEAAVYSYKFGFVMTDHLDRMGRAASHQQHILAEMPGLVAQKTFLTTPEITKRGDEVQDLLSGLLPASPVSGQAYRKLTLQVKVK